MTMIRCFGGFTVQNRVQGSTGNALQIWATIYLLHRSLGSVWAFGVLLFGFEPGERVTCLETPHRTARDCPCHTQVRWRDSYARRAAGPGGPPRVSSATIARSRPWTALFFPQHGYTIDISQDSLSPFATPCGSPPTLYARCRSPTGQ